MCCIKDGIDYFKSINPIEARNYGHNLVIAGAKKLAEIMGTELLIKNEKMIPCMCCFEVPGPFEIVEQAVFSLNNQGRCCFYCVQFDGKVIGRVCGWVHNEMADYEKLAEVFLEEVKI